MPRHARGSGSAASTITLSPSISSSSQSPHYHHSTYLHNTSYGLIEPAPLSIKTPPPRPSLLHRRKSSSSSNSPVWSDWDFDLKDLKGRSVDLSEKIGDRLPGVKYSAAFISTLRVNLALSTALAPPSPNLLATSPGFPPPSRPLSKLSPRMAGSSNGNTTSDPLANIPPLDFEPAKSSTDRTDSMKLISDSITQQRSVASTTLIFHPLTLAIFALIVSVAYPFVVKNTSDLPILFTSSVGLFMCVLLAIRYVLKPYEDLAEQINWKWLGNDDMVVARFGSTVIGTCVYHIEPGSKKKSQNSSGGTGVKRALIRAWTVRRRERGRGVGRGLLEKAVELCCREKGCESMEFAPVGLRAGADRVLPDWDRLGGWLKFNVEFEKGEARAEQCLRDVMKEKGVGERKRRGSR